MSELVGKHHRIFCDEAFWREQPHFWEELARGQFKSGLFMRYNSRGEAIWLEATYNPIRDEHGKVVRVIKFASDITAQVSTQQSAADAAHASSVQTDACARKGSEVVQQTVQVIEQISQELSDAARTIDAVSKQSEIIGQIVLTIRG
ncbi:PAS domain S-box protein, partial [Klebsiella pneumoniae]